jgi:hypothetical protein
MKFIRDEEREEREEKEEREQNKNKRSHMIAAAKRFLGNTHIPFCRLMAQQDKSIG